MGKQIMMFGAYIQLNSISKLGEPLEKLNAAIDWKIFRLPRRKYIRKEDNAKDGRLPMDEIMTFKLSAIS